MPAFMFEKISSAPRRVQAPVLKEPPGVIVQMLGRLAESRLNRGTRASRRAQREIGYTEADVTPHRTRGE